MPYLQLWDRKNFLHPLYLNQHAITYEAEFAEILLQCAAFAAVATIDPTEGHQFEFGHRDKTRSEKFRRELNEAGEISMLTPPFGVPTFRFSKEKQAKQLRPRRKMSRNSLYKHQLPNRLCNLSQQKS